MKQFTYKANNNNKSTASSQNTKSLINFDNNRCVFLYFFLSSVRYSPVPEKYFEPRRFQARPLRFDAVFISFSFLFLAASTPLTVLMHSFQTFLKRKEVNFNFLYFHSFLGDGSGGFRESKFSLCP